MTDNFLSVGHRDPISACVPYQLEALCVAVIRFPAGSLNISINRSNPKICFQFNLRLCAYRARGFCLLWDLRQSVSCGTGMVGALANWQTGIASKRHVVRANLSWRFWLIVARAQGSLEKPDRLRGRSEKWLTLNGRGMFCTRFTSQCHFLYLCLTGSIEVLLVGQCGTD